MDKPTDSEILESMTGRGGMMTYVVKNLLARKHPDLQTAFIRRRLCALEKEGKVIRVDSPYEVQICWKLAPCKDANLS